MAFGAVALVFCLAVLYTYSAAPGASVTRITEGILTSSPDAPVEGQAAAGSRVMLPSHWRPDCPRCTQAWYEFRLTVENSDAERVLYLPRATERFAVYLNGEPLAIGGDERNGLSPPDRGPRIVRVPAGQIKSGPLRLLVFVRSGVAGRGELSRLYLGRAAELMPYYYLRKALEPGMARFAIVFCVIVGVLLVALWAQRRPHREYGLLALVAVLWAAVNIPETVYPSAQYSTPWRWFEASALAFLATSMASFTTYHAGSRNRVAGFLPWLAVLAVPLLGAIALGSPEWFDVVLVPWTCIWLLLLVLGQLAPMTISLTRDAQSSWPVFPIAIVVILATRDAVVTSGLLASIDRKTMTVAASVYVGVFAWRLLTRFIDTLRSTEELNLELDQMVRAKTREIERQYLQMQSLEYDRILAHERERIMRDMHDGVGGQLVSTMAMIDAGGSDIGQMRDALSDALTDMRLMIDSLDPVNEDLNAVLAMFRDRMQPQLSTAGVDLKWQVHDLPPVMGLGPSNVLGVLRIMQETITNTLKHATADVIVISTRETEIPPAVEIEIADNGTGFDVSAVSGHGHGLSNMRERARQNGIDLQITSGRESGTRIVMRFAVSPDTTVGVCADETGR